MDSVNNKSAGFTALECRVSDTNQMTAHSSSIVEGGATIGIGTSIWHHAHVRAGATIGDDCTIGKNVYIDIGAVVGSRCKIQNNVSIFNGVTLEDGVFVGPGAVFTNDLYPRANSELGWEIVPTHVGQGAAIGANATILCGTQLGSWSTVGAGSVLIRSTVAYELVVGNPARHVGWTCRCGQVVSRQNDFPSGATCARCDHVLEVSQ